MTSHDHWFLLVSIESVHAILFLLLLITSISEFEQWGFTHEQEWTVTVRERELFCQLKIFNQGEKKSDIAK